MADNELTLWTFESFEDADQAYNELRANGFSPDQLKLEVRDDEAGPVEGNFWVGNTADLPADNPSHRDTSQDQGTYDRDFAKPVQRGSYMLMVQAVGEQAGNAASISERFGGRLQR